MRTVILAAGEGNRLRPHTLDRPKCLVPLRGRPLLDYQLAALREAGLADVTLVTGHAADRLVPYGLPSRHNAAFASTNMVASLFCAADLLDGGADVLVAYGDLVYEARVLRALIESSAPFATTVDRQWLRLWRLRSPDPLSDAETLRLDAAGDIVEIGRRPTSYEEIDAQYMGLTKISAGFAPAFRRFYETLDPAARLDGRTKGDLHFTGLLQAMIACGLPLRAVPVDGGWLEIDTVADLACYEKLSARGDLDALCRLPGRAPNSA